MDLAWYYNKVSLTIASIRKVLYDWDCDLGIREVRTAHGLLATDLLGQLKEPGGYSLKVDLEYIRVEKDGSVHRRYRYRIRKTDGEEIIRFQTDARHAPNAHFPPYFRSEDDQHFTRDHWPEHLRELDFLKIYALFREIRAHSGELPEPFKSARP